YMLPANSPVFYIPYGMFSSAGVFEDEKPGMIGIFHLDRSKCCCHEANKHKENAMVSAHCVRTSSGAGSAANFSQASNILESVHLRTIPVPHLFPDRVFLKAARAGHPLTFSIVRPRVDYDCRSEAL